MNGFSPFVAERLRYYVYLLIDPRTDEIFYVGKGRGNRVFEHARAAIDERGESEKLGRIREILGCGLEVRHELLRFGLAESVAFEVEAAVIQVLGLTTLSNTVTGHHVLERGRMSTGVAISLFDAPPAPTISENVILFRIPKLWYPSMPAQDLYEATHGWWTLGKRRERADYAFAVSRGVIREVYRIHSWRERRPGDRGAEEDTATSRKRWGFDGTVASELPQYRNKSVRHLFKKGEAGPFKYVNC